MKSIYAAFFALCLCFPASAQVLVTLSPSPILQFLNADATPASGGEVFIYAAGTTTKIATYIDSTGTTPNTDPIILDTRGDASIWIQPGIAYKYVLAPPGSSDPPTAPIWTVDNISIGSTSVSSTTNLQNTSRSSVPTGIILRVDYAPGNGAPPMWFTSETGNCTSNGRVNDGGSCVNATDGNSWVGTFPTNLPDIREFGAVTSGSDSTSATTAAITYALTINGCAFVPSVTSPFVFTQSLTLGSSGSLIGRCLKGPRAATGYSAHPNVGCQMQFTSDTNGIVINTGGGWDLENLSICGDAATSLSSTQTVGILEDQGSFEGHLANIYIQNFVVCRGYGGSAVRQDETNIRCADQNLYPNLVNQFPLACVQSQGGPNDFAADVLLNDECREQSFGGQASVYSGDNTTTWFDISKPSTGIPLFAADGINVRVGANTTLPNGHIMDNAPWQTCGVDYTLWDITFAGGSGSGGTQVYCSRKTVTVTRGSPLAIVTACAGVGCALTSDIPAVASPYNIEIISDHGLDIDPRITSVNNSTHTLTMTGNATATDTLTVEIVQIGIKTDGCGATVCGTTLEARFGTAPPAGSSNVGLYWHDPTGQIAYDLQNTSDYITIKPVHTGGYRTLLRYLGNSDGGVHLQLNYFEFTNQIADVETPSYGVEIQAHNIINFVTPGAYSGSPGKEITPWYVALKAGPTKITFNNSTFLYNGADNGGDTVPGYVSEQWYHSEPPGTQYTTSGVAMGATDTIYCTPLVTGATWNPKSLGIYITDIGTTASLNQAIYTNDPVTNRPGLLAASTGNFALTGGTSWVQNTVGSTNTYSKGFFWACEMGTWAAPPSAISLSSANGSQPTNLIGSSNWELGFPDSFSTTVDMFGNSQPVGVSYHISGLFAAGFPASLSGLTTDVSPAITPLPATGWASN